MVATKCAAVTVWFTAALLLLVTTPNASAQATDEQMELCGNDGASEDTRDEEILEEAIVVCTCHYCVRRRGVCRYGVCLLSPRPRLQRAAEL